MDLNLRACRCSRARHDERLQAIAERWHRALLTTSFTPRTSVAVRCRIVELAESAIRLLHVEPFDHQAAESLGSDLVLLGFCEPAALRYTQEVLGRELVSGLSSAELAALHPRLVALLGAVSAGFASSAHAMILAGQDQARNALLTAHQETLTALQATEARLRTVVNNAPIILFAFDRTGVITLCEGQGLARLRYRPEDLVGRSVWEVVEATRQVFDDVRLALSSEISTIHTRFRGAEFEIRCSPL